MAQMRRLMAMRREIRRRAGGGIDERGGGRRRWEVRFGRREGRRRWGMRMGILAVGSCGAAGVGVERGMDEGRREGRRKIRCLGGKERDATRA